MNPETASPPTSNAEIQNAQAENGESPRPSYPQLNASRGLLNTVPDDHIARPDLLSVARNQHSIGGFQGYSNPQPTLVNGKYEDESAATVQLNSPHQFLASQVGVDTNRARLLSTSRLMGTEFNPGLTDSQSLLAALTNHRLSNGVKTIHNNLAQPSVVRQNNSPSPFNRSAMSSGLAPSASNNLSQLSTEYLRLGTEHHRTTNNSIFSNLLAQPLTSTLGSFPPNRSGWKASSNWRGAEGNAAIPNQSSTVSRSHLEPDVGISNSNTELAPIGHPTPYVSRDPDLYPHQHYIQEIEGQGVLPYEGFRPMRSVSGSKHEYNPADHASDVQLAASKVSANYKGVPWLRSNQSADIPDQENCSIWITNLPPDCKIHDLLGSIRGCGKIYAAVINPPNGSSITAAAKVVFFDRLGATGLLNKARLGAFLVRGYVPRVVQNRIKSAAREPGPQSRVIHIEGPNEIVNESFLHEFFLSKFTYEIDEILTISRNETRTRLEWRFSSFRCQAEAARQSIGREKERVLHLFNEKEDNEGHTDAWRQVEVHFGVDPCA